MSGHGLQFHSHLIFPHMIFLLCLNTNRQKPTELTTGHKPKQLSLR